MTLSSISVVQCNYSSRNSLSTVCNDFKLSNVHTIQALKVQNYRHPMEGETRFSDIP